MNVSEAYTIGFDITDTDEPTLVVFVRDGNTLKIINTINGDQVINLYEQITAKKYNKNIESERK